MNILFVNGFGTSPSGKARFNSFTNIIKSILKKISQKTGMGNFLYKYRTPYDIDDHLYDYALNSNDIKSEFKRNFDKIDIVFIDGNEKFLPWDDKGLKLCSFIKLCKITNKFLFASGVAMESLIYYIATGSHNDYHFINSKGEITSIEELKEIPESFLKEIKKNDNFLDFVTGDIMQYHNLDKTWISVMNIGLHKQISAEKYYERGKFVLPDLFKGKDNLLKNKNSISSNYKELRIQLTKQYLSHYLVNNLPVEFTTYTTLTWFPHNFNVSYRKYQYKIIGMSIKGPVLIEHENSVGAAFHPNSSYKESIMILENFIIKKYNEIQGRLYKFTKEINEENNLNNIDVDDDNNHLFRGYKINDEQRMINNNEIDENGIRPYSSEGIVCSSSAFSRLKKFKSNANYVGFSFNNRDMVFVENNSIIQRPVSSGNDFFKKKNNIKKSVVNKKKNDVTITRNENTRISQIFKDIHQKDTFRKSMTDEEMTQQFIKKGKKMEKIMQNNEDYLNFINKEKMDEDHMIKYFSSLRREITKKLDEINIASEYRLHKVHHKDKKKQNKKNMTTNNFFHKSILKNKIHENKIISNNKNGNKNNQSDSFSKENKEDKNNNSKETIKYDFIIEPQHHGLYNQLDNKFLPETTFPQLLTEENKKEKRKKSSKKTYLYKRLLNENKDNKITSMTRDSLYVDLEKIKRKEFIESKKKWLSKDDFHRVFGLHTTSIKPIPNVIGAGVPISYYKYRDIHPDKWLTSSGFVV